MVSKEQEDQLRFVMQIVQQQATEQFGKLGEDFTRDSELWIQFYARYPLLFNFRERESKHFEKKEFFLTANEELIMTELFWKSIFYAKILRNKYISFLYSAFHILQ